ncbi:hypothetical protein U729_3267 (plasmid) [Clostridium baratii str. Sullivan]|uniref:Uncharacterized protein n=1 Tax=Clostridium baratii str. Sullivan TaxID=1415775 RepID=A0A0A7G2X8_9CLOT|nr:helix-turn-helix domain-containing protein [Clostridium baratii]AIY85331.1 hypothetical protein U729_3267 [Clostridium baratii str. Sullivan]
MAIKMVVDEIRRLSQEEGLNDLEIAKILGCSQSTVSRARSSNNIPRYNVRNRKDKSYVCLSCNKEIFIARKEKVKLYCPECKEKRQKK